MAASLLQNCRNLIKRVVKQENVNAWKQTRTKYVARRKRVAPEDSPTWQQLKEQRHQKDQVLDKQINIGFPKKHDIHVRAKRRAYLQMMAEKEKNKEELERKARHRELKVPIDDIKEQDFAGFGQQHIYRVAEHYGIYKDTFGDAFFYPQMMLNICYDVPEEEDMINPVFYGNVLSPAEAYQQPHVQYEADPDKLYTLCMTAPDSHLQDNDKEYLHWMVGNIPGMAVQDGECLCDYLQPFPVKGTGYHRYVFIIYQQEGRIDFTEEKRPSASTSLVERSFETLEWYRKHQDALTPISLAFFQSAWDDTVRDTFHNVLDMGEPSFEFIHPAPYIPKQQDYPIKEPFNIYLDRYRDVKDINEEVLCEKLRNANPFKPRPPPRKYPLITKPDKVSPSWLKLKNKEKLLKQSYWRGLDD